MALSEEQRKLIEDNYCLVEDFIEESIKENKIPDELVDEFVSETLWKFCISALKFEDELGFKFSTYAYGGFYFSLKNILSKNNEKYENNLDKEIKIESKIEYDFLKEFINKCDLKEKELNVIEDRFYNNLTFKDIGKKYGFSKQYARVIVSKILKKIHKKAIADDLSMTDFYK